MSYEAHTVHSISLSEETWTYKNQYHREDGPAIINRSVVNGDVYSWCKHGKLHRFNGPAHYVIRNGKILVSEFWFNGFLVADKLKNEWTGKFYDWTVEQNMDIDNITDEDEIMIKMVWG